MPTVNGSPVVELFQVPGSCRVEQGTYSGGPTFVIAFDEIQLAADDWLACSVGYRVHSAAAPQVVPLDVEMWPWWNDERDTSNNVLPFVFRIGGPTAVPSLGFEGLIVLAMCLATAATLLLRSRR